MTCCKCDMAKAWDEGVTAGVGWVAGKPDPVNPYLETSTKDPQSDKEKS